jgi:hypothetical protein
MRHFKQQSVLIWNTHRVYTIFRAGSLLPFAFDLLPFARFEKSILKVKKKCN